MAPPKLHLITGFLGSGKTTLLNGLLASLPGERVGVVVNEWGKLGVDGRLLADPASLGVVEVSGGQLFCACVSGGFLAALDSLRERGAERIVVETSGLAKPALLGDLVAEAGRRAGGALDYRGLLCAVDAVRFPLLRGAALAVEEQAAYADFFVLTKTDLVSPEAAAALRLSLAELRPDLGPDSFAEVVRGAAPAGLLDRVRPAPPRPAESRWEGWGPGGRPASSCLRPASPPSAPGVLAFLDAVAARSFRAKGFLTLSDGSRVLAQASGGAGVLEESGLAGEGREGLVVIWSGTPPETAALSALWREKTGTELAGAAGKGPSRAGFLSPRAGLSSFRI